MVQVSGCCAPCPQHDPYGAGPQPGGLATSAIDGQRLEQGESYGRGGWRLRPQSALTSTRIDRNCPRRTRCRSALFTQVRAHARPRAAMVGRGRQGSASTSEAGRREVVVPPASRHERMPLGVTRGHDTLTGASLYRRVVPPRRTGSPQPILGMSGHCSSVRSWTAPAIRRLRRRT